MASSSFGQSPALPKYITLTDTMSFASARCPIPLDPSWRNPSVLSVGFRAPVDQCAYLSGRDYLEFQMSSYTYTDFLPEAVVVDDPGLLVCNGSLYSPPEPPAQYAVGEGSAVLYGRTPEGHSVAVVVSMEPMLMVQLPSSGGDVSYHVQQVLRRVRRKLRNEPMTHVVRGLFNGAGFTAAPDGSGLPVRESFLELYFRSSVCRRRAQDEVGSMGAGYSVVEASISPIVQTMQRAGIRPCGNVRVPLSCVSSSSLSSSSRLTHCDLEVCCPMMRTGTFPVEPLPVENDSLSESVLLSFDIEAVQGECICISSHVVELVSGRTMRALHMREGVSVPPPPAEEGTEDTEATTTHVFLYSSELAMLEGWRDFVVVAVDADYLTGYNTSNFDFPFLYQRVAALDPMGSSRFKFLGRMLCHSSEVSVSAFSSRAHGTSETLTMELPGRVHVDMCTYLRKNKKFRSYKLSAVAKLMLNDDKEDLSIPAMNALWMDACPRGRWEIARYCFQDAKLVVDIFLKELVYSRTVELARVRYVFPDEVFIRGQMYPVLCQLYVYARSRGYCLGMLPDYSAVDGYKGATVLPMQRGVHRNMIILDFASLYPSIMIDKNMCASSMLGLHTHTWRNSNNDGDDDASPLPRAVELVDPATGLRVSRVATDIGVFDFQQSVPGLLPGIAKQMLDQRRIAKRAMRAAGDAGDVAMAKVQGAREQALKVSANSIYGAAGASATGKWACPGVAAAVTAYGRELIERTSELAAEMWIVVAGELGLPVGKGLSVVYGDTDSVMVTVPLPDDPKESFRLAFVIGRRLAALISAKFGKAIVLEFENVARIALLMEKKRYLYDAYSSVDADPKNTAKGVSMVRRDSSPFACKIYGVCTECIMRDDDVMAAIAHVDAKCLSLLEGGVPHCDLVLSRQLAGSYSTPNHPQVAVARQMELRQAGSGPSAGMRVQFVVVALRVNHARAKLFEKVEDAAYAEEHHLALDVEYYIKSLRKMLSQLFDLFGTEVSAALDRVLSKHENAAYRAVHRVADIRKLAGLVSSSSSSSSSCPSRKRKAEAIGPVMDIRSALSKKRKADAPGPVAAVASEKKRKAEAPGPVAPKKKRKATATGPVMDIRAAFCQSDASKKRKASAADADADATKKSAQKKRKVAEVVPVMGIHPAFKRVAK